MTTPALCTAAALVPQPQDIVFGEGCFTLRGETVSEKDVTSFVHDASIQKEGYRLDITPRGITVASSDEAGRFYAVETLKQLADAGTVPCARISDAPAYPWRGVFLDESRHFFGKGTVKRFLDLAAMHKFNVFHWHVVDDQGWRIALRRFPEIEKYATWRPGTPPPGYEHSRESDGHPYGPYFYTAEDVREIVAYAAARHIDVVPEIELPGHSRAILAAYPQFACEGDGIVPRAAWGQWGISRDIWCAGNEEGMLFLEALLDEVCDLFGSSYVHIGGDECPMRRWKECPKCQERMRQLGLVDERGLQAWMTSRFTRHLAARGCKAIGWDEILDGEIPRDALVMSWRGTKGGVKAAGMGHDVIMTPFNSCYFIWDQGIEDDPYRTHYPHWSSKKTTLKTVYDFNPRAGLLEEAARHVVGAEGCLWTEYIYDEAELMWNAFPRACALAEVLWRGEGRRGYGAFLAAMARHLRRLAAMGASPAPLPSTPPENGRWAVSVDGSPVEVGRVSGAAHGGDWWYVRAKAGKVRAVDADGAVHAFQAGGPTIVDDERRQNALIVGDLERNGPLVLSGRANEVIRGVLVLAPNNHGIVLKDCVNVRIEDSVIRADGDAIRVEGGCVSIRNCILWSDGGTALKATAGSVDAADVAVHFASNAIIGLASAPGRTIKRSDFRAITYLNDNDDVPIVTAEGAVSGCRFRDIAVVGRRGRFTGTIRVAGRSAEERVDGLTFENVHTFEDAPLSADSKGVTIGPFADNVVFREQTSDS